MIQIITDNSADIPRELLAQYDNVHIVPLTIEVNGREYTEGVDLTPQQFYRQMYASPELPKTSQPTPARFARLFTELSQRGKILCMTISSGLSGTYNSALLGKELSGNPDVVVFDTEAGSIGQGLQVLKAAEMVKEGLAMDKIVAHLERYRREMKFLIVLDTLENIVKGGRLNRFQGSLAKLLNIKVILHNVEAKVEILERVRGHHKALQRVIALVSERCSDFSNRVIGITHVDNLEDAQFLAEEFKKRYHPKDVIIQEMGATIATYAGKSGLIIAF